MKTPASRFLVIHTDEHVWHFLGCMEHSELKTPHIDALAADGIRFNRAYTCNGVCVPSRATLMTGRYPIAHGVTNNRHQLPRREKVMGEYIAEAGIATGYFGKTHYGRDDSAIQDDGWQETFLKGDYQRYLNEHGIDIHYPEGQEIRNPRIRHWNIGTSNIPYEHYFETVIADRAIDFIDRHRDDSFLCFISNIAPHSPYSCPDPFASMYDPETLTLAPRDDDELAKKPAAFVRWIEQNRKYMTDDELRLYLQSIYGLISLVDEQVGRVVQTLKQTGLYEQTTIIFTSDHGDFSTAYGILGKAWCMDDRLMRVPLTIRGPGIACGATSEALVENVDILPTILDLAGINQPTFMQGRSLKPVLDDPAKPFREFVCAHNAFHNDDDQLHLSMIRKGDWKLVLAQTGEDQLFNLADDPNEFSNLIDQPEHHDLVAELRDKLLRWHIGESGQFYQTPAAGYWESCTHFYDEDRFTGG